MMPTKVTDSPYARQTLQEMLEGNPEDWNSRKILARLLYDAGETEKAAELVWDAPEIPSVDFEIAFAARILAKGAPRKAIRLLSAVLEQNRNRPGQNLGLANALLHFGLVMQAARFYGAAIESDGAAGRDALSPDLEHFLLWTDTGGRLWNGFEKEEKLADLPWMTGEDAEMLKKAMKGHTTPIRIPTLPVGKAEKEDHSLYIQSKQLGADPSPPPAVTIPLDRVAEKDRLFDPGRGAAVRKVSEVPVQSATAPPTRKQA